jgi:hypothetical protein
LLEFFSPFATFRVAEAEQREVVAFVQNLKKHIVE